MGIEIVNPGGSGGGGTTVTTPFFAYWYNIGNAQNDGPSSNNVIAVTPFNLPYSQTVTNIILHIGASDGSNNSDVGIYDSTGSRKCHAGAQTFASTGVQTFSMTGGPFTFGPGTYVLAITSAATTMKVKADAFTPTIYYYSTATSATAGALPASITLTASASGTNNSGFGGGASFAEFILS